MQIPLLYSPITFQHSDLAFLFSHTETSSEQYFSFVNGQETTDGGTHLVAFKEGIVKGVNEFFGKNFSSQDIREGLAGCIAIKIASPIFESQTKNKLGNTNIRAELAKRVKEAVLSSLKKNPSSAERIQEKIKLNEKTRKNAQFLKQELKDKQKNSTIKSLNFGIVNFISQTILCMVKIPLFSLLKENRLPLRF